MRCFFLFNFKLFILKQRLINQNKYDLKIQTHLFMILVDLMMKMVNLR